MTAAPEVVVLLEGDGRLRVVRIPAGAHTVLERCHHAPTRIEERIWMSPAGERAATGQRIFREVRPPAPTPPPEQPLYDELTVRFPETARPAPGSGTRGLLARQLLTPRRGGRVR